MVQGSKERKHFYAISRGRCDPSVISSWLEASPMVNEYPKNKYRGFYTFSDAREWLSENGHETFHFWPGPSDGPKTKLNEHSGRPTCYVATDGREATILEDYHDAKTYVKGCRNSTMKSYADRETAKSVLEGFWHVSRAVDLVNLNKGESIRRRGREPYLWNGRFITSETSVAYTNAHILDLNTYADFCNAAAPK